VKNQRIQEGKREKELFLSCFPGVLSPPSRNSGEGWKEKKKSQEKRKGERWKTNQPWEYCSCVCPAAQKRRDRGRKGGEKGKKHDPRKRVHPEGQKGKGRGRGEGREKTDLPPEQEKQTKGGGCSRFPPSFFDGKGAGRGKKEAPDRCSFFLQLIKMGGGSWEKKGKREKKGATSSPFTGEYIHRRGGSRKEEGTVQERQCR